MTGTVGATVTYTLRITNTGNTVDTFDLGISGNAWVVNAPSSVGPLAAGVGADVVIEVTVAPDAANGDSDTATVTVTSMGDPTASADALLTTTAQISGYFILLPLIAKP